MSGATFDKTLVDIGRRDISIYRDEVENVTANFIVENYPKFVELLKEYYHFNNEEESPTRLVDELFLLRDISQTDLQLLQFIEDEYLLGQSYFKGFEDRRAAAKYSNTLYRSKGTKYSIQQFFRTFYGIDPDVVYTKENVFTVGEDRIGAQSQRYLTDDKLYQTYAILIKSDLALDTWRENYKLFTHPAGMYLGAQVQIVGVVDLNIEDQPNPGIQQIPPKVIETEATLVGTGFTQATALFDFGARDTEGNVLKFRTGMGSPSSYPALSGNDINDVETLTLENLDNLYSSMGEFLEPNSPTLDDDSDGTGGFTGFDISSTETIDQDVWTWQELSGDSDGEITLRELL